MDGMNIVRLHGSHHSFKHPVKKGRVVVPHPRKDLPIGTVKSTESETNIQQFVKENVDKLTKKEVHLKTDTNGNIYVTSVRNV